MGILGSHLAQWEDGEMSLRPTNCRECHNIRHKNSELMSKIEELKYDVTMRRWSLADEIARTLTTRGYHAPKIVAGENESDIVGAVAAALDQAQREGE